MNKISVLIIDDDEVDRLVLKRDFEKTGLELAIFEKTNGVEAIEFFQDYQNNRKNYPEDFPPLITFLDINMPLMNGFEFLEQFDALRNELDVKTCIVMMFSSSEREEDKNTALNYGFVVDYLVKGEFSPLELKEKMLAKIADS